MDVLQAVVLGAVQGLTEFLPVSSSGHLILFPALLGWEPQGLVFDITVHAATLCAILLALRRDIVDLGLRCWRGEKTARLLVLKLLAATVPVAVVGLLWEDNLLALRTTTAVALSLIGWGLLLALADRYTAMMRGQVSETTKVRWSQALFIGCLQIFSLIPGTSRSGATITAGLFSGIDRATATKFAFLLAVPAILGAAASTAIDVSRTGLDLPLDVLGAGFVSALVFGILAIRLLLLIVKHSTFLGFAIYRIALGIFVLLYL